MSQVITGNKIFAHLSRVLNDQRPITADIFLDNYCNNRCPYCAYRRWELDDGARHMSFEDFVKYAMRLRGLGVLGFILSGGGEPTIAQDFQKIVRWLDTNDFKWGINTNFNRLFRGKPEYLKVSLDAWDEDSYERSRGVRAYERVRENIRQFAESKAENTRLGIQLLAHNAEDVVRFYSANADLPVDYIVIRPVESTNGIYYKEHPETRKILDAIEMIKELDARVILNYKWHLTDMAMKSCLAQWSQIAINEAGEVMYCCHKPYQIIGHVMDEDILEKKRLAHTDMKMCDIPCRLSGCNHDLQLIQKTQLNPEFI